MERKKKKENNGKKKKIKSRILSLNFFKTLLEFLKR